jgi:HK97 family phage major capsid protein/ATP-dependent Clp endopeptidase proteolytic subunit ClpP
MAKVSEKKFYSIKAKADSTSADIYIYDQIGAGWFDEGVTAKNFVQELNALKVKNINLHINSPGGSVFDGLAIYNALRAHKATVNTFIEGLAASIASVVALAGDTCGMAKNALFMIHNPTGMVMGGSEDMRKTADILDKLKESICQAYVDKTGMTPEECMAAMDMETWYNADEAMKCGFVDAITEAMDVAALAKFDLSGFRNIPQNIAGGTHPPVAPPGNGGQSGEPEPTGHIDNNTNTQGRNNKMEKCIHCGADIPAGGTCGCQGARNAKAQEMRLVEANASTKERDRVMNIQRIAAKHKQEELGRKFVNEGKTAEDFGMAVLEAKGIEPIALDPNIGMNAQETRRFSLLKVLNALANPSDRKAREEASFEFEASAAVADKMKKQPQGVFLPNEVLTDRFNFRNDLTVAAPTGGGDLVQTSVLGGSFIDVLLNRMMVLKMGALQLGGLIGNMAIPRMPGGATAYWVSENNPPTESQANFDQVALSPKTVGAFTDISRKLLLQSSLDVEGMVRNDLARQLALAIDLAAINGDPNNGEPQGILGTTGIGDVTGDAAGAAPTWAHIVNIWSKVSGANADFGSLGFLTNPLVVGKLMQTLKSANNFEFIMKSFPGADGMTDLAGARCGVSNQVPPTLVKGGSGAVCSPIIYGNWADLIVAMWGALDILVDPYSGGAAGTLRVRALQDVDVSVRHAESFSAKQDVLTT